VRVEGGFSRAELVVLYGEEYPLPNLLDHLAMPDCTKITASGIGAVSVMQIRSIGANGRTATSSCNGDHDLPLPREGYEDFAVVGLRRGKRIRLTKARAGSGESSGQAQASRCGEIFIDESKTHREAARDRPVSSLYIFLWVTAEAAHKTRTQPNTRQAESG
jgi:hypothetical protein